MTSSVHIEPEAMRELHNRRHYADPSIILELAAVHELLARQLPKSNEADLRTIEARLGALIGKLHPL